MKDRQLLRVKVINGPDDLPKDRITQYHCFTKSGNYYYLYGNTLWNNSYHIDWYLISEEQEKEPEVFIDSDDVEYYRDIDGSVSYK
jgi:hypothetical protein